jgi:hypothetical protein
MNLQPSFHPFRKIIIDTLVTLGWTCPNPDESLVNYCIAGRDFKTLAGQRTAFVWFNPWFECMGSLSGEYITEGKNVLSTTRFNMNPDMSPEAVATLTTQFSNEAIEIINGTTMIRAMQTAPRTGNHTTMTTPRTSNTTTRGTASVTDIATRRK